MLPELQAERQLLAIEAATMAHPNLEPRVRAAVLSRYQRRLEGRSARAKTAAEALGGLGIPVIHEPAPARSRPRDGRKGKRG
jgi:hypothetical protein